MVMRYKLTTGKEFVIIDLHNSTFDKGGTLPVKELKKLHSFCSAEYLNGNYVDIGGDWNYPKSPERGFEPVSIIVRDLSQK